MDNEEIVILIQQGHTELYTDLWERVSRLIGMIILKSTKRRILPPDIDKEDLLQCGYFAMLAAPGKRPVAIACQSFIELKGYCSDDEAVVFITFICVT